MKILIRSSLFSPSVGGIETVMRLLAEEFTTAGHEVKVISGMLEPPTEPVNYVVHTCPSFRETLSLLRWCDVVCQSCMSLKEIWYYLIVPRPVFVIHHTWYQRVDGRRRFRDRLKLFLCRFVRNIAISRAMQAHIGAGAQLLPNPYDDSLFVEQPCVARDRELVFVGRLVLDKGGETLLRAMALLQKEQLTPQLTIIGDGPEREKLKALAAELGISDQVRFAGTKSPAAVAEILNRHKVVVVPSLWEEPFGIVALEGIACGCVAIGSERGGLQDAIGPCGVTFPNGNAMALKDALMSILRSPSSFSEYLSCAPAHLDRHKKAAVAAEYLSIFKGSCL